MAITISGFKKVVGGGKPYDFQFMGLSTDEKPTEVNGNLVSVNSLFWELDTGDFYFCKTAGTIGGGEYVILPETEIGG